VVSSGGASNVTSIVVFVVATTLATLNDAWQYPDGHENPIGQSIAVVQLVATQPPAVQSNAKPLPQSVAAEQAFCVHVLDWHDSSGREQSLSLEHVRSPNFFASKPHAATNASHKTRTMRIGVTT
jgi:hypothetical protein